MRNRYLYIVVICLFFCALSHAQAPTANFKSDITSGCAPIIVSFQDISTGNPTSWSWDFGNGSTSTLKNPSTTYLTAGTYTVTLTATNASGSNTITQSAYINVYEVPTVDFIYDKNSGCTPYKIQFTDQSTAPPGSTNASWFWDFGDGQTSTEKNPAHIYRVSDNFTVTLRVTTDKGCSKTITKANIINIIPGVALSFSNSLPTTCAAPATINFSNSSSGPGTVSYLWKFGDGQTSTAFSPSHTYNTIGSYTVSLIASSSIGCSDTLNRTVDIGNYKTDFTAPQFCEGRRTLLTNTSSPAPVSSQWIFPDGTTSTDINPRVVFTGSSGLSVKLINNYGNCSDSITKTITPTGKPNITFAGIDSGKCSPPSIVNFNNTTGAVSYVWDFGDGSPTSTQANPSHTYTQYGTYSVTLVATNAGGCIDTLTKKNYIQIKKPIVTLPNLPLKGCIPYTANFQSVIVDSVEPIASYLWNFGDGSTSTQPTPSHVYNTRGDYDITLTITTKSGCVEKLTIPKGVSVGPKPVADFSVDQTNVCAGTGVNFTDLSTPTLEINEWKWEFSDGQKSNIKNPAGIIFQDTGWIDVTLIAINNGCESNPVTKKKLIYTLPPVSKFDYRPDCNNRTNYTFTDRSIDAATWVWDFGDGSPGFTGQAPPAHNFPGQGNYTVSLTTTKGACSYTGKRVISITDNTPDFMVDNAAGCKPFQPHLTPNAPNPGLIQLYTWDFGNGNSITSPDAHPIYTTAGYFNVTLTTTDTFGCQDSRTKANFIRVNGPLASFTSTSNQGCKGLSATFTDQTTTDGINAIVKWHWEFGDGTNGDFTQPPFTHVYDTIGNFDVQMFVQDAAGCIDNLYLPEYVKISTLKANWDVGRQTCPGAAVYFSNNTQSQFAITSFWELGDGNTSTAFSLNHAYADTGFYSIKLKVRDQIGCEDSLTKTNYVQVGLPKADFTANNFVSFCTPFEAKFTNTSTFYSDRSWNLDIATSRQENPSIYYVNTGTYNVTLTVTSPGGCTDDTTKQVRVFNPSDATLTYGPTFGCAPLAVNFEAFTEMNANFVWDYGDGNVTDTTINKISHTYTDFGKFIPKIIMTEPSGICKIPLLGTDTIYSLGAKSKFTINKNLFCDSGYLRINDSTSTNDPSLSYFWDYGDGYTSTNPNDTVHYYLNPGNYSVLLRVTTANGCADSLQTSLRVVASPSISITSDSIICANDRIIYTGLFNRVDTSVVNWIWAFPNGNTSNQQNPPRQTYNTPGDFNLTVYATNSSGCVDSVNQSLKVHALPTAVTPSSLTMQSGFPITIPATYSSGVVSYSWLPDNNTLSCIDCRQPVTTNTKFTTKYSVSYVDSNGCKNTNEVNVIVICKDANVFVPNTFSPNGDGSNDVFYVRGRGLDRVKSIRVFNRWGQVVFEQKDFPVNDPSVGWDGKFKGSRPQPDVYVYQVEVFCENSEIIRFEGNVALIQ